MAKSSYRSTVLVTGGTAGLGYEAALALARQLRDCQIVIASRSNKEDAATKINNALHQSNTVYLPLDLASPDSIAAFASNITKSYPQVSHLVFNAGLQFMGQPSTLPYFPNSDIEKTFAINHLGHAHLFYLLLPHLINDAHIINVASGTHDPAQKTMVPYPVFPSAQDVAQPDMTKIAKNGQERYSTSKLCNILWTYALDRHAKSSGKAYKVNAFDPGLMFATGLVREAPWIAQLIWNKVMGNLLPLMRLFFRSQNIHTPKASGEALAWLAIGEDDGAKGVSGKYFEGRTVIPSSNMSYEEKKQEDLYSWTLKYLAREDAGTRRRWESLDG